MEMGRLFTEHPASVGETYGQHLCRAAWFGGKMMLAGAACIIHAVLPFLFVRTGSETITELNARMNAVRSTAIPKPTESAAFRGAMH